MSKLAALLYTGSYRFQFSPAELEERYRVESIYRMERGITGVTLLADGNIMEYIEGEAEPLGAAYAATLARIGSKPLELMYEPIPQRLFSDWTMAVYGEPDISGELVRSTERWEKVYASTGLPLAGTTPLVVLSSFWDSWSRWTPRFPSPSGHACQMAA